MRYILLILNLVSIESFAQSIGTYKNATAFIYNKDSSGNPTPNGTCFLIGRQPNGTTGVHLFLVTAKHVLENNNGNLVKDFYVRMNTKDSNSRFIYCRVDTSKQDRNVFFHSDKSVDLAVIFFDVNKDDYDYKYVPQSFIPDRPTFKSYAIDEGVEIFFAGLFVQYIGEHKISPIFRFGHVSLVTEEKLMWVGQKRELILLEVSSFGGNSGAPVYGMLQRGLNKRAILLGVLSGTFRDVAEIQIVQTKNAQFAMYNNGISGVTPSYLLDEILHSVQMNKIFGR